jgi:hypothetical protein
MARRPEELGRNYARSWGVRVDSTGLSAKGSPRVLLEVDDGAEAFARLRVLEAAGYHVSWCPGPDGHPARRCPLVCDGACPLVDTADVVVTSLRLHRASTRDVLDALARSRPELRVVVEATAPSAAQWAETVGDRPVLYAPTSSTDLVAAVGDALRQAAAPA